MPKIKSHLEEVYRTNLNHKTRKGYLCLDMNEGVSGVPASFIKGVLSEVDSRLLSKYPEYKYFIERLAAFNNIRPQNLCLANGSDAAIKYIFDAFVSPRDKILLTDPTFAMYPVYCKIFNARPVTVAYTNKLKFPFQQFLNKLTKGIKMAVVVNPNNPCGDILESGLLLEIIKRAKAKGILLLVDEAYFYFQDETVIEKIKNHNNLIVLRTFSKLYSLATLRIGYAAACPKIINGLKKVKPTFDVNGIALLFAEKLLKRPDIIKGLIGSIKKGKEYLLKKLTDADIEHVETQANFLLIKCGKRVREVMQRLSERKVLVGGGFKQSFLKDYIRVTLVDTSCMKKFWESFFPIWKGHTNVRF